MAVLKYQDTQGNYQPIVGLNVQNQVVQTTGQSTTAVMSQKAVSDLVPAQASSSNQLADKDFVNSSITTATATYRGNYNLVSDLSLTISASHGQIETALATKMTALSVTPDNNDYAFVQIPTADATPTEIASVERYKFNGTLWSYEYTINNSGFTAEQWAAVNSGITSGLVAKLGQLTGNTYSAQNGLAGLFGIDNNGTWQNIVPSDLASVLSAQSALSPWRGFGNANYNFDGDLNDVKYACWGFITEGVVKNGPTGFGTGTFMVIPIYGQYYTQVVFGNGKTSSRRYLFGSWSAWT